MEYYAKDTVIISDDKRVLPEHRIKDYEAMIAELQEMKCNNKRTVLRGQCRGKIWGTCWVDELISVSSRHSTDERQHSVCTYVFRKNGSQWKIKTGALLQPAGLQYCARGRRVVLFSQPRLLMNGICTD